MESQFLKPPRVMKFGPKNLIESYREIGGKIIVLDWEKGMSFGLIYQKVRNIEGSRNQDSTVHVCIILLSFYDPTEDVWFTVLLVSYQKAIF